MKPETSEDNECLMSHDSRMALRMACLIEIHSASKIVLATKTFQISSIKTVAATNCLKFPFKQESQNKRTIKT